MHILLIDDERTFLETIITRLRLRGIAAEGVDSGEKALEAMRGKAFDAVVLDVSMPGMDGVATLRELKRINSEVPVIMLTGHATLETADQGMDLGAFDYMMKPCPIDELLDKVSEAIRSRGEGGEARPG
ncbi:response regulator [Desulfonatronum lacustre]|uniref:response regulator n=1 Tax=Desulfonatronum lacustre TaxID=66849 RepID=UPI0004AC871D|nr:response regulator [Desulfonatronum lacustre]SMP66035.1 Response regulator receiver domain-containing protein [Desulfonatronum zhilinae]